MRNRLQLSVVCNRIATVQISTISVVADAVAKRPVIFVTARVHPGETPASFVMHGFVEWLLSSHVAAQKLRQGVTVVVVPMLNPDGVFLGNYR